MTAQLNDTRPTFHIGAVARMTGLSPDIIRAWERRYGVVAPSRTPTKHRLYSREDIGRLALIKGLVDSGDRIGAIAGLSVQQLQQRLNTHDRQEWSKVDSAPRSIQRIAVLGDVLPARLERHRTSFEGVDFVLMMRNRMDFEAEVQMARPHLIVIEYPTVHDQTGGEVQELLRKSGAAKAVIIYGFGSQRVITGLDTGQITPLRAPVDVPELRHILAVTNRAHQLPLAYSENWPHNGESGQSSYLPDRRYSDDMLALIASAATPVQCECPYHLVDLIRSLAAFESYSAQCERREPADALLHSFLHATTAQARSLLEGALARVAEAENIPLPDRSPST